MDSRQFYTSNNLEKYPDDGKLNQCKKCLTLLVDVFNPDTYLWILEELDVPYVPSQWNEMVARYGKNNGALGVLGRYVSIMHIKQFKRYRWADTQFLQDLENKKVEEAMRRSGYAESQIAEVIEKGVLPFSFADGAPPPPPPPPEPEPEPEPEPIEEDIPCDLSEEEKNYLYLKWGRGYKPYEWVQLEQLFQDMMSSYDIQTAGDKNTLILACKSSLKANQLMDLGDIEGAQKAARIYDNLMHSGKWTAAQIKDNDSSIIDSIGAFVAICETEGFIPRYYVDKSNDQVDKVIEDMQKYTNDLVMNENNIEAMIERAVRQMAAEEKAIKNASTIEEKETIITDEDFIEFNEFQESLSEEDKM